MRCISNKHVKSPPLGMIFTITMKEKVGERLMLGPILAQTGLVWSSPVWGKHPPSAFLQDVLLNRHRVLAFFPIWRQPRNTGFHSQGCGGLNLAPALSHIHDP